MATIRGLVEQAGVGDDIQKREIELGEVSEPCDLLIAGSDRANGDAWDFDHVWAAGLEVNPVSSFVNLERPTTLLDVTVIGLPDASAAGAAVRAAQTARCPQEEFRLDIGMATAQWSARTVTVESTSAQLTTATVSRVDPEAASGMRFLPGDARLIFAHGQLLISIEALTFWPRKLTTGAEVTAMAQEKATSLATAIVKTLPPPNER
ncbi:hypothetical protein [Micromonospora echinospora]|uniref:hypothetical protein n=1 Tax=Micromonospora echinospora TaxID=1877 RepID=UPI003A8A2524